MGLRNKSVANSPQEGQRIGHEEDRVVSDQSCLAQRTDRLRLTEVQNKAEIKVKDEAEQGAVTSPLVSFPSHFLPLNLNLSLNLPLNALHSAPHVTTARKRKKARNAWRRVFCAIVHSETSRRDQGCS